MKEYVMTNLQDERPMLDQASNVRERIVRGAGDLLSTGGRDAVTAQAVSVAAGVQPRTIEDHFGSMQGLLDVVARETLAHHVDEQAIRTPTNDPVEDVRRGWDLYIAFGLAHPDAFALLYGAPSVAASVSVIDEGVAVLQGLVTRIAEAGRLRAGIADATQRIHAAATGVTLALATTPPDQRPPWLSETMREAILGTIIAPVSPNASASRAARRTGRPDGLTGREVEVLALVSEGWTNKEIAALLVLSVHTVERHIQNSYRKIGVRNRADAAAYAVRADLNSEPNFAWTPERKMVVFTDVRTEGIR
jgi:DNA-binding CsgD family transcriptional regulator